MNMGGLGPSLCRMLSSVIPRLTKGQRLELSTSLKVSTSNYVELFEAPDIKFTYNIGNWEFALSWCPFSLCVKFICSAGEKEKEIRA